MGLISLRYVAASFTETIKVSRTTQKVASCLLALAGLQPLLHSPGLVQVGGSHDHHGSSQEQGQAPSQEEKLLLCAAMSRWWLLGS